MRDYSTITMTRKVGCGAVYCLFIEEDGAFHKLFIRGDNAKETPCGESWLNSLAAILTYALRRSVWEGTSKKAIVKHLLNHRCNNPTRNWQTKEESLSCSHAIGIMVLEYLKARNLDVIEEEKEEAGVAVAKT
jgi:hypothetical protein